MARPPLNVLFIPGLFGTALSKSNDVNDKQARLWPVLEIPTARARHAELANKRRLHAAGLVDDHKFFNRLARSYRQGFEALLETIAAVWPEPVAGAAALYDWRFSPLQSSRRIDAVLSKPAAWNSAGGDLEARAALTPVLSKKISWAPNGQWLIIAHSMGGLVAMDIMDRFADRLDIVGCVCVGAPVGGSIKAARSVIDGNGPPIIVRSATRAIAQHPDFEGLWALVPPDVDRTFRANVSYVRRACSIYPGISLAALENIVVDVPPVIVPSAGALETRAMRRDALTSRWWLMRSRRIRDIFFLGSKAVKTAKTGALTGSEYQSKWTPVREVAGDDTVTFARSTMPNEPLPPLTYVHQKQMFDPVLHEWLQKLLDPGADPSLAARLPGFLIEAVDGAIDEGEDIVVYARGNSGMPYTIVTEVTYGDGGQRFVARRHMRGTGRFERVNLGDSKGLAEDGRDIFVLVSVFEEHISQVSADQESNDTAVVLVEGASSRDARER